MPDLFDVLAEPTRRDILAVLKDRVVKGIAEMSVGELVDTLGITQPTVSKHLKVLREHGLVQVREDGQHRYYRLDAKPLESVATWLEGFTPSAPAAQPMPVIDMPYVDLWPAGYQMGSSLGQLRRQIDSLLGRVS